MLSALITSQRGYPTMLLAEQLVHQWLVHPGPLVLGTNLFNFPTPTEDRDRTVSRRSEPSSRTALNGEQPYPWDRLQPQDAMSRHRGAKPPRRCELLGRSACYPRRTFYPLSDGPSTQNHRITMTDFRLCSTCRSHSQASLCHYTQQAISIRFELTFVSLRYYLGRRPPQSNYPPDIVLNEDNSSQLVTQIFKGGISRMAPTLLASSHHSLPPILHMNIQATVSSCSKGARGLSVFPRVGRNFHLHYNFTGSLFETAPISLRHSCRSVFN